MRLWSARPKVESPRIPSYNGGKFPLSTFLASRVRRMIHDPTHQDSLPPQVRDWIAFQKLRSHVPSPDELLIETFPRGGRHYMCVIRSMDASRTKPSAC